MDWDMDSPTRINKLLLSSKFSNSLSIVHSQLSNEVNQSPDSHLDDAEEIENIPTPTVDEPADILGYLSGNNLVESTNVSKLYNSIESDLTDEKRYLDEIPFPKNCPKFKINDDPEILSHELQFPYNIPLPAAKPEQDHAIVAEHSKKETRVCRSLRRFSSNQSLLSIISNKSFDDNDEVQLLESVSRRNSNEFSSLSDYGTEFNFTKFSKNESRFKTNKALRTFNSDPDLEDGEIRASGDVTCEKIIFKKKSSFIKKKRANSELYESRNKNKFVNRNEELKKHNNYASNLPRIRDRLYSINKSPHKISKRNDLPRYNVRKVVIPKEPRTKHKSGRSVSSRSRSYSSFSRSPSSDHWSPPEVSYHRKRKNNKRRIESKHTLRSYSRSRSPGIRYSRRSRRSYSPSPPLISNKYPTEKKKKKLKQKSLPTAVIKSSISSSKIEIKKKNKPKLRDVASGEIVELKKAKKKTYSKDSSNKIAKKKKTLSSLNVGKKKGNLDKHKKNSVKVSKVDVEEEFSNDVLASVDPHFSSFVSQKEVYAYGDKIMVSVNFGNTAEHSSQPKVSEPSEMKPSCIIDIISSPYQVFEPEPTETIDLFSDEEKDDRPSLPSLNPSVITTETLTSASLVVPPINNHVESDTSCVISNHDTSSSINLQKLILPRGPCTPPRGPCTPPPPSLALLSGVVDTGVESVTESIDMTKGPQTPVDEPLESYDPCDPTMSPLQEINNDKNSVSSSSHDSIEFTWKDLSKAVANNWLTTSQATTGTITSSANCVAPFLAVAEGQPSSGVDVPSISSMDTVASIWETAASNGKNKTAMNLSVNCQNDLEMESPFSPQSDEMSDIFNPPLLKTPITNRKMGKYIRQHGKTDNASRKNENKLGRGPNASKHSKHIHMKIVDDKLRIIDEVPTSAVEMAVKEKFLKKVHRQERIVEEVKLILKPFYCRKKINKEVYKHIMRRAVPKIYHCRNGEINTAKIKRLVLGYVNKCSSSHKIAK